MKKALSLLLVLVMLCGMMPITAFAAEEAEANPWNGRSAVFVGDSITAGSGTTKIYYEYLGERLGFDSVTPMGVAGSCISAASDYGQSNQPLINRYQDIPSADLIVIFMGTNDYGHETPLGNVGDTQDGTFYGALNMIISALVVKHPSSKIVFVTPLHRYGFGTSKILGTSFTSDDVANGVGATLGDYVDALKTVCANNGVSVIDLYTECTLDPADTDTRTNYMPDGLHPNAAGHEAIAGIMESHIRGFEPAEQEPIELTEMVYGNRFATGNNQTCRASSRINYYLKAGTVITLKNADVMQWACTKTSDENSSSNLGYFPDSGWSDKETAVVAEDGWIGFTFKYRDETQSFDLTKPLSDYITIHTHSYNSTVTAPTCMEQGYTTYTCTCGDSYADDYVDATGHSYENGSCTGCGVAAWDTDGDGALEILAIGNSFSVDALEYAYQIARDLGIEEIVLGNLYIGGCTLATHAANAAGDLGKYTYYYNDNGTWTSTGSYKISTALESRSWDYVSMQQGSPVSGVESSYNEDLTNLIAYVRERSDAKLVWHMTWAYQQNSTHSAFPIYGKDQMTMYNAIVSAVQNKIVTNSNFDLIVPNGTAVQNSRTSLLGDTTTRDGYHMSYDYGRYLTGLLFVKTLTGLDISNVTYAPSGVDAEEKAIAIESANNAAAQPFAVTKSKNVNEVPEEGYILLQTPIYQGAYWHPMKAGHYNELIDDQSNSPDFFTTIRFTRETLPVGSIIVLESGWQYRPDGWVTDTLQTGARESVTAKAFQIITEEWWKNYSIRSFNVSRTTGGSVMDLTEEEMRAIFRIYVPEEKHSHDYTFVVTAPTCTEAGYTTYTCTLCGDSYVDDYVDATGHAFENGICTACDAEHPNLTNYEGKVISILGDSISTFAGYIPVADGFNLQHRPRYPQSNLFSDVNLTWWMQTITALDAKLGINDSWAGSTVTNTITGNSGDLGEKAAMASLTRIQNLGANGTPDVILFYGGTNDIGRLLPLGSFDPATAPTEVDLTTTKWTTVADAYVDAIMRLQYYYPEAEILAMLPTYTASYYTNAKLAQYNTVFSAICEHYGIPYIDLRDCGISTANLPDGIHPDATGMDYITEAVLDTLLNNMKMEAGEHIVHSVTHNLNGAESSLGYYKGITHGKSFVTTITGENVTVSVTMGGADITDTAYANGVVTIAAVTGDLVITAQGRVKPIYEDHLQQLPKNLCCSTNLWSSLVPENTYYTGSAWGNVSGNSVYSITIPVAAGDQIWATSFQKSGTNGGSRNGIRLTWFDESGVLESVSPDNVYTEFSANGYLTAPEGVVAVNVVMWNGNVSNEVYILNRGHIYENGICTACGAAQPGPVITQQPVDGEAKLGERYMVEVKVEGEGLKYQWYFRNAGSKNFSKSSVKDNTYDDVMTETRAAREVYCVITDANGNSVTTDTVKLICIPSEKLEIVTQPTDGEAVLGERYCVTVEAKGEGLKYQWYFRNKGATNWSKSSVTDNTYDDIMNNTRAGREVYCVITDRFGNKVTTDTVKLVRVPMKLEIISQPTDATAAFGEQFCATVMAKGEGLKYQWYYRNAGSATWRKSGVRDNTYNDVMTKARAGREVYCVITDRWGNSVTTDTVKLIAVPTVELKLLGVTYEAADMGERYCVTVEAEGEGLTYTWYFRNAGATRWSKSSVRDNTYDDVMNRTRANREVYCVITDACSNQVVTEVVTLYVEKN